MRDDVTYDECLRRLAHLAFDFHRRGDISPARLVSESRYAAHRARIGIDELKEYFRKHPELVGEWIVYSDNKRVSSGWHFSALTEVGPFRVGFYPPDRNRPEIQTTDGAQACAAYVKLEAEGMI